MRVRIQLLALFGALTLLTTPCAAAPALPVSATLAPLPFIPETATPLLAPDGSRVAFLKDRNLCVAAITGASPICAMLSFPPDPASVQWSPDGAHLTFTENFFVLFVAPHIWVMDTATGAVTNLTDDGVTGSPSGKPAVIAYAPQWSMDSAQIIFLQRTAIMGSDPTALCTVPVGGGAIMQIGTIPADAGIVSAFSLAPDGGSVAYPVELSHDSALRGIWITALDGTAQRRYLSSLTYADVAFSPDGTQVLAFTPQWFAQGSNDQSSNRVYAADGGSEFPVDSAHPAQWAVWQPGGSALAYIVSTGDQDAPGIYVAPQAGGAGVKVLDGNFNLGAASIFGHGFVWATNNTAIVFDKAAMGFALVHFAAMP